MRVLCGRTNHTHHLAVVAVLQEVSSGEEVHIVVIVGLFKNICKFTLIGNSHDFVDWTPMEITRESTGCGGYSGNDCGQVDFFDAYAGAYSKSHCGVSFVCEARGFGIVTSTLMYYLDISAVPPDQSPYLAIQSPQFHAVPLPSVNEVGSLPSSTKPKGVISSSKFFIWSSYRSRLMSLPVMSLKYA